MADVVQARYDELDGVAQRFEQLATSNQQLVQRVSGTYGSLADGGWVGLGADAFQGEMSSVLFPALQRLSDAMLAASSTTLAIKSLIQQNEGDASSLFRGGEVWQFVAGSVSDETAPFGASDGSGIPDWLRGLVVAPGAVLSGIPFFAGIVPKGYSHAGEPLFLHFGGSGTDTIFSIHPWDGFGRPGFDLKKPTLRFDYGPVTKAFLPDGTKVSVPATENFFHWNIDGANGIQGKAGPLWSQFGTDITRDHQLLSNAVPKGNIIGEIRGATLIKGASHGLLIAGAAMDAYSIATADNKVKEASRVAGGWSGAWAGAEVGGSTGALIGSVFPGPGTAIGGFVGGVAGGIYGYMKGSDIGEWVYDLF